MTAIEIPGLTTAYMVVWTRSQYKSLKNFVVKPVKPHRSSRSLDCLLVFSCYPYYYNFVLMQEFASWQKGRRLRDCRDYSDFSCVSTQTFPLVPPFMNKVYVAQNFAPKNTAAALSYLVSSLLHSRCVSEKSSKIDLKTMNVDGLNRLI